MAKQLSGATTPSASSQIHEMEALWHTWRGSPELLAHVARVALRSIDGVGDGTQVACLIDLQVDDDHELFVSPSEFLKEVTPEGLNAFDRLRISAEGRDCGIDFTLVWRRGRLKRHGEADVQLDARGTDQARVRVAFASVSAAAKRGGRPVTRRGTGDGWDYDAFPVAVPIVFAVATTCIVWSCLYLLDQPLNDLSQAIVLAAAVVVGVGWAGWVRPALEVVPFRKSRLVRTLKVLIPVALGFIAGL
jgi:hypothetical protein